MHHIESQLSFNNLYQRGYHEYKNNSKSEILDYRINANEFLFKDLTIQTPVIISNEVHRQDQLTFENIDFTKVSISRTRFNKQVKFSKCTFRELLQVDNTQFEKALIFEDCAFNSGYSFADCNPSNISLQKSKVLGLANFSNCNFNISINETHFETLTFDGSRTPETIIDNTTIIDIYFGKGNYSTIKINNTSIDNISFIDGKFDLLAIQGLELNNKLIFQKAAYNKIYIEYLNGPGKVELFVADYNEIKIELSFFEELSINTTIDKILILQQSMIRNIKLVNAICNGDIKFIDVEIPENGRLTIANSDLRKTNFLKCNFQACRFEFSNSKVQEIFLSETDFPKRVVELGGNKINYAQAQFVFGQLQNTYQKQGDNIRANEYLSREVESHYHTIPWFEKRFFIFLNRTITIPKWFGNKFFTKTSLSLHKFSTDFGRNWFKGVIFTFGVGLLFFYFLMLSTTQFSFAWNAKLRWDLLDSFLKFMNPLRHFETDNIFANHYKTSVTTSLSHVWDFLGRIFVAYGYYQTIQAFRRFGKK